MAERDRLTWRSGADQAAKQPVLPVEQARKASAHPATPDEGAAHPAYPGADPGEHDYENGDTSSWAEDPTKGPYPPSAHPATPDEGPAHPAYKWAADQIRVATERKAAKCIRIASALLTGCGDADLIEDQALDLMDLSDDAIVATLGRLASLRKAEDEKPAEEPAEDEKPEEGKESKKKAAEDEEPEEGEKPEAETEAKKKAADEALLRRLLAEEEMEEEEEPEEGEEPETEDEAKKKAAEGDVVGALEARIRALESMLAGKKGEEPAPETPATAEDPGDVESMLKAMLAEEEAPVPAPEAPATACTAEAPEAPATAEDPEAPVESQDEMIVDLAPVDDPMALLDEEILDDDEEALLANLFADHKVAAKKGEDEEEEEESEESEEPEAEEGEEPEAEEPEEEKEAKKKAASKTASQKPQPKKASQGARRLGGVTQTNSTDVAELAKLWPSAPDVSKVFGS